VKQLNDNNGKCTTLSISFITRKISVGVFTCVVSMLSCACVVQCNVCICDSLCYLYVCVCTYCMYMKMCVYLTCIISVYSVCMVQYPNVFVRNEFVTVIKLCTVMLFLVAVTEISNFKLKHCSNAQNVAFTLQKSGTIMQVNHFNQLFSM